jgi:flagellar protein FliS
MDHTARNQYLEQEVMTASPQKLQLMLVEAAMRSAEKARECWHNDDNAGACEAIVYAESCLGELLGGLNYDDGGDLVRKLASLYMFAFRRLVDANQQRDEKLLDEALRVLGMERDTWRQVCEQCAAQEPTIATQVDAGPAPIPAVDLPGTGSVDVGTGGFSAQA